MANARLTGSRSWVCWCRVVLAWECCIIFTILKNHWILWRSHTEVSCCCCCCCCWWWWWWWWWWWRGREFLHSTVPMTILYTTISPQTSTENPPIIRILSVQSKISLFPRLIRIQKLAGKSKGRWSMGIQAIVCVN